MKAALLFRPEQHLGLGPRSQEGWGLTTEACVTFLPGPSVTCAGHDAGQPQKIGREVAAGREGISGSHEWQDWPVQSKGDLSVW